MPITVNLGVVCRECRPVSDPGGGQAAWTHRGSVVLIVRDLRSRFHSSGSEGGRGSASGISVDGLFVLRARRLDRRSLRLIRARAWDGRGQSVRRWARRTDASGAMAYGGAGRREYDAGAGGDADGRITSHAAAAARWGMVHRRGRSALRGLYPDAIRRGADRGDDLGEGWPCRGARRPGAAQRRGYRSRGAGLVHVRGRRGDGPLLRLHVVRAGRAECASAMELLLLAHQVRRDPRALGGWKRARRHDAGFWRRRPGRHARRSDIAGAGHRPGWPERAARDAGRCRRRVDVVPQPL